MIKKLLFVSVLFLSVFFMVKTFAKDVYVNGYTRKDGTYVRPHSRSSPDNDLSNNYGQASSSQRQQYPGYTILPSYNNDQDGDGVINSRDSDDDNDGISDNNERKNRSASVYATPFPNDSETENDSD